MSMDALTQGPNIIHPEIPSAVGSRNSLNRNNRDEYAEGRLVVNEEVDKILNHIHAKLPPEAALRSEVMGTIKSKLHRYYNQNTQNMLNRYLTTIEDEMGKKVRDLVDHEELRGLNRYSPRTIAYLLDRIAGADKFNTSEIEKSMVNIFGHLQGHVQREMNDLETHTNSLLRRKTDVGAFVRGENAYAIVKCSFRDYPKKPDAVYQMRLSLNVLESELVSRVFPFQATAETMLKELLSFRIQQDVDTVIERENERLMDEGKSEMNAQEKIFQRIRRIEDYLEEGGTVKDSYFPVRFLESVQGIGAERDSRVYDSLSLRDNIGRIVDEAAIRNRGWNTAVNALTHVLDWSRMGYQHVENFKSGRRLIIREYQSTEEKSLPDERYSLELIYYTAYQLRYLREAYMTQLSEFERTVQEVENVVHAILDEHLENIQEEDWHRLSKRVLENKSEPKRRSWFSFSREEEEEVPLESEESSSSEGEKQPSQWNELVFIDGEESSGAKDYPTVTKRIEEIRARFQGMGQRMLRIYGDHNPLTRVIVSRRIQFLKEQFSQFASQVNPFHINPGLVLDMEIITIKRKSATMMNMANVLNEFLYTVSTGFTDQAFAAFSRRRSTQREDFAGEFMTGVGAVDAVQEDMGGESGMGSAEENV